jgi:hypothetical protein
VNIWLHEFNYTLTDGNPQKVNCLLIKIFTLTWHLSHHSRGLNPSLPHVCDWFISPSKGDQLRNWALPCTEAEAWTRWHFSPIILEVRSWAELTCHCENSGINSWHSHITKSFGTTWAGEKCHTSQGDVATHTSLCLSLSVGSDEPGLRHKE